MAPRRRTIVLGTAAVLLSLVALVVAGVVALTQTERGLNLMLRAAMPAVKRLVPGRLYVGTVRGNLFTDITIDTLDFKAPDGTPFISSGPIHFTYDPRDLLDSRIVVKSLEVQRPHVTLVDYGNDDWNLWRAIGRNKNKSKRPSTTRLGQYIVIDTTAIHELQFVARLPWFPSDTLHGRMLDSAVNEHLHRLTDEFRREDGRYVHVLRFLRGSIHLGRSRIADPDSAGLRFAVRRMDVVWNSPPMWFQNLTGTTRILKDTLWVDDARFTMPGSRAQGTAHVVWGGGLPVRYDIRLKSDSVSMTDLAWIDETIPHSGSGRMDLVIKNDPRNLSILEYQISNMDARSLKSRLLGDMTWGVGGPETRLTNVNLRLEPAHTDLLRWFNAKPFPFDWQGRLTGTVKARGGFMHDWKLDEAKLAYADEHVPGAESRAVATGMLNIYQPAEAVLKGVDLKLDYLDFRTPRFVNPLFPKLNGFARGTMRLDSLWYDARFSNADVELVDGPGQPSRFTGAGRYTLIPEGVVFDVDMQALPLSYTTLSRSYQDMPLRGEAVGRIKAKGMAEQFDLQTTLSGEGGQLSFTGVADALDPVMGANGAWSVRGGNLRSLFGTPSLPASTLNASGSVDMRATLDAKTDKFIINTIVGPLSFTLDQFSRVADARLYGGTAYVRFDSGRVHVDTLAVESSALRVMSRGILGLDQTKRDTLRVTMAVDSLGGLRPWLTPSDSGAKPIVLPADTLRGSIELSALLSGSLDTLDTRGLDVDLRADLRDVVVASSRARRASFDGQVRDVLRGATGNAALTADSAVLGGIDIASMAGRTTLVGGLAERFGLTMRTPSEARIALAGGVTRRHDSTDVRLDTILVRVDSGMAKPRGFALAAPATIQLFGGGQGALDSLVLQHTDTGRVALSGVIGAAGIVSGRMEMDRVPLGDIGALLRTSGLSKGSASARLDVSGTRERPKVDGTVDVRNAVTGRVRIGDLYARAHYDSLRLLVAGGLRVDGKPALEASASLPLDLALVSGRQRQLDEPLVGRITSPRTDLALLESLFPDVTRSRGSLETDVNLTGTWDRPRLRGQLKLDDASLSLNNLGIRLDNARADIGLAGDTIYIRRFGATSGLPTDSLGVSGVVAITDIREPSFDLRLAANNFLAIDKARTASITLTTPTPITLSGSSEAPRVRGAVRLDRGRVYINQLAQRRALDLTDADLMDTARLAMNALLPNAPSSLVRNLQLDDVRIGIGDDMWLRSPEANLKLGGQLRVTRSLSRDGVARLALADSLTVERGTYQLNLGIARPGFEVERGLVRFFGDPDLEPSLDITALHVVRETRANSNRQDVRIRVNIGGTVNRPTLALTSADNPPLPESDMLSYLVTGEPAYSLLGTNSYAEQGATLALRLAGSYLSSRLAGGRFDVVQVEPTALAPGEVANLRENGLGILASTRVGVGGQVARNTYLTFSTGLCGLAPSSSGGGDAFSLFAQGLGVKLERRFDRGLSASLGLEPGSSAQACGRLGISRTFQQTPPQIGIDFFRFWTF
jgi:translocation and assembly module TamB